MISKFEHVRATVEGLAEHDQYPLAFGILDHYYTKAKTLEDYELIGALALKIIYPTMAVRAAEATHALCVTPEQLYSARINLNKAYYAANQPELSVMYAELNLEMNPDDFDLQVALAAALKLNNQRADSEALIERLKASNITPDQRQALKITSTHPLLREGRTAEGIRWFLHTDKDKTTEFSLRGMRIWDGVARPGTTLYVNAEGGIGDEFINIRFFHHLRDLGMRPMLYSILERPDLLRVWERNGFETFSDPDLIDKATPWTYLLWLPIHLNVTEADLWRGPYITPKRDPAHYLGPHNRFRVGIKSCGNPYFAQDTYRRIPIDQIVNSVPEGAEIYLFDLDTSHPRCVNVGQTITSWDQTLDLLDQMDIVFGSCTSIIHAAGAMSKPAIVCVPILEYYVWTSTRTNSSSPWYGPNMHVVKQSQVRSWEEPLAQAHKIINQYMTDWNRTQQR